MISTFLCCLLALITKRREDIPSIGGYIPLIIQSDSMKGIFDRHDLIIDREYEQNQNLEIGDIITFYTFINGIRVLNTHVIYDIKEDETGLSYLTKGYHNESVDDSEVHPPDIVGIYCFRVPLIGRAIAFMQTSFGFFLCILVPLALLFLVQLIYTIVHYVILMKDNSVMQMKEEYETKVEQLKQEIDELKKDKESR